MKNTDLMHQHGGDLDAIERKYGIPKNEIMDFSGNINPLGFPPAVKVLLAENIDLVTAYPDKKYSALKESIGAYCGAVPDNIVVGNGSTELISTFIKATSPKNAVILGPAYSEYENELKKNGSTYRYFPLEEKDDFKLNTQRLLAELDNCVDFFVACNPNNPTGSAITTEEMRIILTHCKNKGIYVLVDETYIEFSTNPMEICTIGLTETFDNVFVIRGISKFFAAPGLRLGYGVSSNALFHRLLAQTQDPWSVNVLAAFAGEHLFRDKVFIHNSHQLVTDEREKAMAAFSGFRNLKAYPSSANFILLKLLTDKITSAEIFEALIVKKMLIRDAASFTFLDHTFLRFCLLHPQQNKMLIENLKNLVE